MTPSFPKERREEDSGEVAEVANVSDVTVRDRYRELTEEMDEEIEP